MERFRSTARIAGHPIHPMTVMFPVVLFLLVWVCDLMFWHRHDLVWATLGMLALALGIVLAAFAAIFGLIDYFGDARIRALPAAHHHLVVNLLVVGIQVANFIWRMNGGPAYVVPTGLVLSTVVVLLLGYSGWQGATLVYRHGVGVDSGADPGQRR
ncbi:hypothetical protein SCH01S_51_01050 [Sphingomonas changbaiensis NBRC 104936]|uniref:DUF2231 domain-containing protein n=1 Tax=Sphingomonas changbaiensis NBRC 104936 TaxID=1219043 RepID=A0A0E9MSK9_9SPHN|nr:DUF2231 domain-containing protein [Sphingomonas changbaiensis]GAO40772.1 hypothetical protein SCH01S_51_01050 [Sphingomonas changbaiensis NBRC 104936]